MTRAEALQVAKPILFNTEMVRAIQNGTKTVTRRVIKNNPCECTSKQVNGISKICDDKGGFYLPEEYVKVKSPIQVNDILYVRETWFYEEHMHDKTAGKPDLPSGKYSFRYIYKASEPDYPVDVGVSANGWRPSIHMPKEAARIFLRVTGVRVERLQDIITGDYRTTLNIKSEGLISPCCYCTLNGDCEDFITQGSCRLFNEFTKLWNSTIKKSDLDKYGWEANPWVWVIEFEKMKVEK